MTKQEKIRADVETHIKLCLRVSGIEKDISGSLSNSLLWLLNDLGVVLRVDRELPERMFLAGYGYIQGHQLQVLLDKIGGEAVEPLIKQKEPPKPRDTSW